MTRLFLLLALIGCGKSKPAEENAPAKAEVTAPKAGEMPEFHLKPLGDTDAPDIATLKERTQSIVSKWRSEETTSDGFLVTYEMPHSENVQDDKTLRVELKQVGVDYGVYMRRMIDGQPFKCVATHIEKPADIQRVVDACKVAKPEP